MSLAERCYKAIQHFLLPRRSNPKRMDRFNRFCPDSCPWVLQTTQAKPRAGTALWNRRSLVSSAWACAAPGCKVIFFPTIFCCGTLPTKMSTVILNCGVILLYLVLENHEDGTGVISFCDWRQDLHVCRLNEEQPTQNPTGRCVSEAIGLQKVHLGF